MSSGHLVPQISRDLDNGYVFEDGERIISFRVKTFQAFVERLNVIAGDAVSRVLSDQMGKAIGQTVMSYAKDRVRSFEELWKVADELLSLRGWGRCLGAEQHVDGPTTVFTFRCRGTPISYERKASEPTCHIMRGVVEGWTEAYLEKKASSSREIECVSTGSSECVFEVTFTQ